MLPKSEIFNWPKEKYIILLRKLKLQFALKRSSFWENIMENLSNSNIDNITWDTIPLFRWQKAPLIKVMQFINNVI